MHKQASLCIICTLLCNAVYHVYYVYFMYLCVHNVLLPFADYATIFLKNYYIDT